MLRFVARVPALRAGAAVVMCGAACVLFAPIASAEVLPAERVDGPSADVLELGGVAMADDGTGGVVYRRREDGQAHVYVSVFTGSGWQRPQRVDVGQEFESTWPRIAASSGGRLLVTWAHPVGTTTTGATRNALYAAFKAPRVARFSAPTIIDTDLGEAAALYPSLAMAANGGVSYVSYVRISERVEYRMATFRGGPRWSRSVIRRRNEDRALRAINAETAPKVAVDGAGNGVAAYVDVDEAGVERVYARRLFGGEMSVIPLQASPATIDGRPVLGASDQFALGIGGFGEGVVVVRQQIDPSSNVTQVFANALPAVFAEGAKDFLGPQVIPAPAGGIPAGLAAGTYAEGGGFRVAYGLGSTTVLSSGNGASFGAPARIGTPGNAAPGLPRLVVGPKGSGALARPLSIDGREGVEIREITVTNAQRRAQVSSTGGGAIANIEVAGSGAGDALVAFRSGSSSRGEISAATVDAPPLTFAATTPTDWVRPTRATVRWDAARNVLGRLRYELFVDGVQVDVPLTRRALRLPRAALDDGLHRVQLRAIDRLGQRITSNVATMRVDGTAPVVTIARRRGRRVAVRITDRGRSGLERERSTIAWGDGQTSEPSNNLSHTYAKAGRYLVRIRARDRAGNVATVSERVVIR